MKITDYVASNINEFPTIAEVLGIKATTKQVTPKSASTDIRKTIAEFDFSNKVIKLMKTNPVYKQELKFDNIADMYKQVWFVLHSPKVIGVTFTTNFYGETIKSMISYSEMIGLNIDIIVPFGKFHTSREYLVWFTEQATEADNFNMSVENQELIVKHCPELYRIAARSPEELIEVLRSQIKLSGYDVSMYSIITTDGINSGVVEDRQGKSKEWSRTYTKHYERYDQTLNDLLNMYISCKYYQSVGIEAETDGINRDDVDSYTGGNLATASVNALTWTARHDYNKIISFESASTLCKIWNSAIEEPVIRDREEVIVPRCACGLGLQNYMN